MVIFVPLIGLFGTFVLVVWLAGYALLPPYNRRSWQVRASAVLGYFAGGLLVWSLVPGSWRLSLWETLHAAFDVEKYGHPVEHVAESIVVWQMFAGVVGATLVCGTGFCLRGASAPQKADETGA
jgi:hypothetical protein